MRGSQDIYKSISEASSRYLVDLNRGEHSDFPPLLIEFLTKLKYILNFDKILVVQPLIMDNRLESFVSGPGNDYSSLDKLRNMEYSERARLLNSLDGLSEFSETNGREFQMFEKRIWHQVIAYPIVNTKEISDVRGGVFFLNKEADFELDELMRKGITLASETIATTFKGYRVNQIYSNTYSMFQVMQESSKSAVCVYTPRGVIVFCNKYFSELTGIENSTIPNRNIVDVLKLKGHNTPQDYHRVSSETHPVLMRDEDAMYCEQILEDGNTLPLRKYCKAIVLEKKKYWTLVLEDLTDELSNINRIEMSGNHDALTGLGNRTLFQKEGGKLLAEEKLPVAVIVGDINGLKLMNDIFGHDYGDYMLKKISDILVENCRRGNVYRVGGDEFYIFLRNTEEVAVREVIESINDDCSREFKELNFIGISLGYSIARSEDDNMSQVIRKAESDMYYIKSMSSENIKNESINSLKKIYNERYASERERTERLVNLACDFAPYLNLRENEVDDVCNSIELIDIGKVSVTHFIPESKSVSSDDEFENLKKHCWIGYKIAALSYETSHLARVILNHHENWDGTGFPQGIKGNAIPFLSRVIRLLAYYDRIVERNSSLSLEVIIDELELRKGKIFDPSITDEFLEFLRNKTIH